MSKQGEREAASVVIHRVADMTAEGRREVCDWLRRLADNLESEPEAFAKTFRGRYLYAPKGGGKAAEP